ncbi:hypothetical protein [Amycolatopsis sp. PS_44_ISF1]|uniref:hypothetical protein n=1 Tax=Amycolatopsis sp. PS_44_ISF1 TaxID=2974917 RepID=UPI0028DF28D7|nr:hypothetical protein [Amycolatopsis sp. PS_44_ISF1]MDT8912990.1 hypothetical protein [Amycolatopsis sp. PS_44_ISF1]
MTAWWGLAGLLGLIGVLGLSRLRRPEARVLGDPLARYPEAREPARPNADAAHTPLMLPRITPEMLHNDGEGWQQADLVAVPRARRSDHDEPVPTGPAAAPPEAAPALAAPVAAPPAVVRHPASTPRMRSAAPVTEVTERAPVAADHDVPESRSGLDDLAPMPSVDTEVREAAPRSAAGPGEPTPPNPIRRARETVRSLSASATRLAQRRPRWTPLKSRKENTK